MRTRTPQKLVYVALQEASKKRKKGCTKGSRFLPSNNQEANKKQARTKQEARKKEQETNKNQARKG